MTSTDVPLPPIRRSSIWSWRRLRLTEGTVRLMLVAQVVMVFAHYVRVPDRIVILSHIHEPIRPVRILLIRRALDSTNLPIAFWWGLMLATATAFGLWLWSAYSLLDQAGDERCFRRVWALAGWFIPFANLYVPKQILNDIVVTQERRVDTTDAPGFVRNWVTAWWVCWVTTAFIAWLACLMLGCSTTVVESQNAVLMFAVRDVAFFVTAVVAWVAVRQVTRQRALLVDDVPRSKGSRRGHGDLSSTMGHSHVEAVGRST